MKKKIVIAGGSGFIGTQISKYYYENGYQVMVLTRGVSKTQNGIEFIQWNGITLSNWVSALEGAETLINLTGKSVDCRYTQKNKDLILSSRVNATKVLGEAINTLKKPPTLWINSSTATIYQQSLTKPMTEKNGDIGNDFSMTVAKKWEEAFYNSVTPNTRKVALRISLVLGATDGVLPVLQNLTRFGLGGYHGNGKQKFAWIHIQDLIQIIQYVSNNTDISGSINCTCPSDITNRDFMKALRKSMHFPFGIPTPKFILQLGAIVMGTEPELILKSRYVQPERLVNHGYKFIYTDINKALASF